MENDSGVVSLGELGEINRWTKLVRAPFPLKSGVRKLNGNLQSQLANGLGQGCWMQAVNLGLAIGQRASHI